MLLDLGKLCNQLLCVASFIISKLPSLVIVKLFAWLLMLDENFRYTPNSTKQAFFDVLGFDFLCRIRFAMLYETPPKMNPVAVAVSVSNVKGLY